MKNKKLIVLGIFIVIIAIVCGIFFFAKSKNGAGEVSSVSYKIGQGYGSLAETSMKAVKISSDGNVEFSNEYDPKLIKTYKIETEKFKKLADYISAHKDALKTNNRDSDDILDGGFQYIIVEMVDGKVYKIGGYEADEDADFVKIRDEIMKAIDEDKFDSYIQEVNSQK